MTDRIARMFPIAALCIVSAVALAACGGGGGKKAAPTPGEMQVMPAVDHPDTLGEALAIAAGQTVDGRIDSAEDRDFFRLPLTEASTVTFWTSGEADTLVALLDGEGNDLAADTDGRASVETELSNVYARVRGGPDGGTGGYRLHNEVVARAGDGSLLGEEVTGTSNNCVGDFKFYLQDNEHYARCQGDVDGNTTFGINFRNQCNVAIAVSATLSGGFPYRYHNWFTLDPGEVYDASLPTPDGLYYSGTPYSYRCTASPPTSFVYCAVEENPDPYYYLNDGQRRHHPFSLYTSPSRVGSGSLRGESWHLPGFCADQQLPEQHYLSASDFFAPKDGSPPPPQYREIRIDRGDWVDVRFSTVVQ